jgi:hypothetical protein
MNQRLHPYRYGYKSGSVVVCPAEVGMGFSYSHRVQGDIVRELRSVGAWVTKSNRMAYPTWPDQQVSHWKC